MEVTGLISLLCRAELGFVMVLGAWRLVVVVVVVSLWNAFSNNVDPKTGLTSLILPISVLLTATVRLLSTLNTSHHLFLYHFHTVHSLDVEVDECLSLLYVMGKPIIAHKSTMNKDPKKSPPPAEDEEPKRRKNRPGRSSRRRKHKARSILLEASGGGGGGQTTTTTAHDDGGVTNQTAESSVVPSDRGYTLEGVKLRRREQWLKRQHASNINTDENDNVTSCCNQEQQHPPINEDEGTSLDPKDDYQLKAQLGFVPGNAICVAARTSLQEVFPSSSSTETSGNNEDSDSSLLPLPPPAVVKLYPMAIRETYRGGTTDGRKFKARRRGAERVKKQQRNDDDDKTAHDDDDNEKNDETNKQKEKMKTKKERRWFIESPVSEEQAADTTRIDAPQDDDDNNNDDNTNADDDDDDESTKKKKQHIVEPFPTIYWLTSPKLRILISQMELSKDNNVPTMEARLRSSQSYLDQMERSHKSYGKSRWELLTPQDKDSVRQRGWENALDERRGVAGISLKKGRFDCVKCLHAHVAHYLAQVAEWEEEEWKEDEKKRECERDDLNLVGKWTMESIEAALLENAGGGVA